MASRSGTPQSAQERRARGQELIQGVWVESALYGRLEAARAKAGLSRTAAVEAAVTIWVERLEESQMLDENITELVAKRDADLTAMGERLAAAQRENEAWRSLNDWATHGYREVTRAVVISDESEPVRYGMRAHVYGGTHQTGPYWYGEGSSAGAAAIDLAVKLAPAVKRR